MNLISGRGVFEMMRGHDDVALLTEQHLLDDVVEDVLGDGDVKCGERIVQQDGGGRGVDGARERHARFLTTRQVGATRSYQRQVLVLQLIHLVRQSAREQHFLVALLDHPAAEQNVVSQRRL